MNSPTQNLTDLELRLEGTQDQLLTVSTDKCLLGVAGTFAREPARCVIYRGRRGTALYALNDQVSVNGKRSAVHWLQPGDSIELLDRLRLTIERLQAETQPARPSANPQPLPTPEAPEASHPVPAASTAPTSWTEGSGAAPYSFADDQGDESILALGLGQPESASAEDSQDPAAATEVSAEASRGASPEHGIPVEPQLTHSQEFDEYGPPAPDATAAGSGPQAEAPALSPLAASLVAELTESAEETTALTEATAEESVSAVEPSAEDAPSLAAQLIRDLTEEAEREAAKAEVSEEAVAGTDAEPAPAEKPSSSGASVAEVLARMKAAGQWDGLPDSEQVAAEPEPEPEPQPEPPAPLPSFESDDVDVRGYMTQLLSRMSGNSPAPVTAQKPAATPKPKPKPEPAADSLQATSEPESPLSPEEFKPKRKAEPVKSLDAMRELANATARSAVKQSNELRRQALGKLQVGIGVASFGLALYYLTMGSQQFGDVPFLAGVSCLGVSGFLAYRFYGTILHNERMEAAALRRAELKLQAEQEAGEGAAPLVANDCPEESQI